MPFTQASAHCHSLLSNPPSPPCPNLLRPPVPPSSPIALLVLACRSSSSARPHLASTDQGHGRNDVAGPICSPLLVLGQLRGSLIAACPPSVRPLPLPGRAERHASPCRCCCGLQGMKLGDVLQAGKQTSTNTSTSHPKHHIHRHHQLDITSYLLHTASP